MPEELSLVSATGNRFALFDGFGGARLAAPAELARDLAERSDVRVDGLLQLLPPEPGAGPRGDLRMVLHNRDGSRAEACGNGLRCVAVVAALRGHGARGGTAGVRSTLVETDAGVRAVTVLGTDGGRGCARAGMGPVRVAEPSAALDVDGRTVEVAIVDAGNPHCVVLVEDVDATPVRALGAALERHARFPERTNVEFVQATPEGLRVRIWERGVGETASCGTGVAASAAVLFALGRATAPLRVQTAGGSLTVGRERGELFLEGEAGIDQQDFASVRPSWLAGSHAAPGRLALPRNRVS